MPAIDFAALDAGLDTWATRLLGIPVFWSKQANQVVDGPHGELDLLSHSANGVDHTIYSDDPAPVAGKELIVSQVGNRHLTLNVQVQTWDQRLSKSARMFLERLRTRARWPSSLMELQALGLAVVRVGDLVILDPLTDDHDYSRASLDVFFSGYVLEVDTTPETYIQSTDVASNELTDVDGAATDVQIDTTITAP